MKIVLVEERNGQQLNERTFAQASVKVGRDPAECHIVFDQTQWPMVSRRHAEIHLADGHCRVVDTNSSFGTFVNSRKVTTPVEIKQNDTIQFGAGGPLVRAKSIDFSAAAAPVRPVSRPEIDTFRDLPAAPTGGQPPMKQTTPQAAPPPPAAPPKPPRPAQPAPPPAGTSSQVFVELANPSTGQLQRIAITKDLVTLGRDPSTDITLDASSAVVSRNHAEIRKQNDRYVLFDKGSFNGTLLNDQRITTPTPLYDGD
ncbi:MAG: FHA domain-containing protein, partial [Pyrinomonadaceae bacterium]